MGEQSGINWTDHTFNPWIGCTKVSAGCQNCYAERMAHQRQWAEWGAGKPRRRAAESTLRQPFAWNRRAERTGVREVVFCGSLMDVFDPEVPDEWRDQLFATIALTPYLDWPLLTKRPERAVEYLAATPNGPGVRILPGQIIDTWPLPNVWVGVSVEDQKTADERLPHLMQLAALGWPVWVSYEPALGPVDWGLLLDAMILRRGEPPRNERVVQGIVVGGESGPGAQPMHPDWACQTRDQCAEAGVKFFFKQWGEWAPYQLKAHGDLGGDVRAGRVDVVHPTGQTDVEVFKETGRSTVRGSRYMERIGKKAAGRELAGVESTNADLPWRDEG